MAYQLIARHYRGALERLALPLAFGVPTRASPEGQARMVFAQAILDGDDIKEAERKAAERAKDAQV